MLIPRFTLRWLFAVTTVVAVIALVASWAGRGVPWAIGVTAAVAMLVVAMVLHGAMFGFVWVVAELTRREPPEPAGAPEGESLSP
jgi:divalent metal cation (Fe/Co/Zn/Cd) transporter